MVSHKFQVKNNIMDKDISKLIKSEADQLTKLQGIVQQSIAEEKLSK